MAGPLALRVDFIEDPALQAGLGKLLGLRPEDARCDPARKVLHGVAMSGGHLDRNAM